MDYFPILLSLLKASVFASRGSFRRFGKGLGRFESLFLFVCLLSETLPHNSSWVPDASEEAVALPDPLNVLCQVVEGKRVEAEAYGGRLVDLAVHGGTLLTPRRLRPLSNLKLEMRAPGRPPVELYAKVIHVSVDGSVALRFTSLPAEVEAWVRDTLGSVRTPGA